MSDLVDAVTDSLDADTRAEFVRRAGEQAADVVEAIRAGRLDNASYAVGLELEAYAVDADGRLAAVPEAAFEAEGVAKELGLHNIEVNTPPTVFDPEGVETQRRTLRSRLSAARRAVEAEGLELVLDGMWTIPPAEGSLAYLGDVTVRDGVTVAANMRRDPRYCALDNDVLRRRGGEIVLDLPGARLSVPTILAESLTTSIQPHLQVPSAAAFPAHYNAAIRTLGPVLALSTNSPFLPADVYDPGTDAAALIEDTHHELRVPAFEGSINVGDEGKVRFPGDIDAPEDVVGRLLDDAVRAPFLREWVDDGDEESYSDTFWELDYMRGTYWRWLRCVVGGEAVDPDNDERSLRIEYRPLPTQPTVPDVVGLQCLVSGLIRGLVAADHPVADLEWAAARESFYAAVRDGLDADLRWVTADGERTADPAEIFPEVFEFARRGLREAGVDAGRAGEYLAPIERRWERRTTPSRWKKARVREAVEDGRSLEAAIEAMQREYVRRSASGTPFADW